MHVFYGTGTLEILNISQNKLQDLPLHASYGTIYLVILNMSQNKLQDLPLHVCYGTVYLEILKIYRSLSLSLFVSPCTPFTARFIWRS